MSDQGQDAHQWCRRLLGADHPDTLRSAFAVAVALLASGAVLPAGAGLDETLGR